MNNNFLPSVKLADVARMAGVSIGTASKALNQTGNLKDETRKKVTEAAIKLGFTPNQNAKSLTSGKSYMVGVITTDSIGRFTIPILSGVEDILGAGQISMIVCQSRNDPIREQHYIKMLLSRRVDGIIITGKSSQIRKSLTKQINVPVVYALSRSDSLEDVSIVSDEVANAYMAVKHLYDTGRRKIVYIGGPKSADSSKYRMEGYIKASQELKISNLITLNGEWSESWGREASYRIFREKNDVDGVFCASDQIARGFSDGYREITKEINPKVAIVGIDNWDVMVLSARPQLSTVDLNLSKIGEEAAQKLLALINHKEISTGIHYVEGYLVKRESTSYKIG